MWDCLVINSGRMVQRIGVTEGEIEEETFNMYVQPGKDAIWKKKACSLHESSKVDDIIVNW